MTTIDHLPYAMNIDNRINYAELVDVPKLQALLDSFNQVLGIANAVIDMDGRVIAQAGWQAVCTNFHRVNTLTCRRCIESDTALVTSMTEGATYAVYDCLNGLVDTAAPILVDGQHVANVFTGQLLNAPPDLEFFRRQAQQFGFDEARYLEAIAQVPIIPRARLEAITRLYAQLAATLADNGMDRLRKQQATDELRRLNHELEQRVVARTQALASSEARFRAIIESSPVPLVLNGDQDTITYLNAAFSRSFGYTQQDIPTLAEWWPQAYPDPDYRQRVVTAWQDRLEQARRTGDPFEPLEANIRCRDGRQRTVLAEVTPLGASFADTLLIILYDITDRKQSELALANFKAIVDSSDDAIIAKTLDGVITNWNHGAEKMFGYTATEAVGQSMQMLIPPGRETEEPEILERIARGECVRHFETVRLHQDGRPLDISATVSPILDDRGRVYGASKIARDITQRKLAEAELAQFRHHLEAMVQERTLDLSIAKEAAEAASRAKSTFLANMSHELRTPMNGIIGLADLALRRATEPKLRDQLGKITRASQHLLAVINDILDISKIEADRLTLEHQPFKLIEVLKNVMNLIGQRAIDKGLQLRIDLAPEAGRLVLRGDAMRLGQVLLNLMGNAVKFTQAGSIIVRVRIAEEGMADVLLRIEVQDSGIGIAVADQLRLFSAFEQADGSMTRKYGGTGLGLAISKRLAEMMGGGIGVESAMGQGSTFWFTVRLDRAPAGAESVPVQDVHSAEERLKVAHAGARLLLVEDEPINQEVARELLEHVGLRVDLAEDGRQAVAMVQQTQYDLILMDVQMPNLNGIDATRQVRDLPAYARTPILAMTASAFDEDRQRCLAAGMSDHIAKPFDPPRLFESLARWLAAPSDPRPAQPATGSPCQSVV